MSHSAIATESSRQRSAITNGTTLLPGVHGNSQWARRFRDLIEIHVSDLGGPDRISEAERSIVRRIAALSVELERLEVRFATTDATADDLALYGSLTNTLRRLLVTLGLERRAKDAVPSLSEVIAQHRRSNPEVSADD